MNVLKHLSDEELIAWAKRAARSLEALRGVSGLDYEVARTKRQVRELNEEISRRGLSIEGSK